jgi:hypothetical protein
VLASDVVHAASRFKTGTMYRTPSKSRRPRRIIPAYEQLVLFDYSFREMVLRLRMEESGVGANFE